MPDQVTREAGTEPARDASVQVTRSAARLAALAALPVALVAGLLVFWRMGGFHHTAAPAASPTPVVGGSAPVAMPARTLSNQDTATCRSLVAHLPETVRNLGRRPVTAGAEQNAAYGAPPLTVGCGGWPQPSVAPDAMLWVLSGTCWYADQSRPDTTTWITRDRRVPVQITIPNSYLGQGGWVQEFTGAVREWVPALPVEPAACVSTSTAPS